MILKMKKLLKQVTPLPYHETPSTCRKSRVFCTQAKKGSRIFPPVSGSISMEKMHF